MTDTPLARALRERIRRDGPMLVSEFILACLHDDAHGYYRKRPAIGAVGDFVTAPEISQVFGELIGLWCAVVWQQMGSPERFHLIEFGPGRGTLMRDALRAARIVPGFAGALSLHLVDSNATLCAQQRATLSDAGVPLHFHDSASAALAGPDRAGDGATIIVANEFLDALPVRQVEYRSGAWRERVVSLDDAGAFLLGASEKEAACAPPAHLAPRDGDVFEVSDAAETLATLLARRHEAGPKCALFVDYGHAASGFGDTLQGVSAQKHVSPFHAPGETDLSTQVDFERFATACREAGLAVDGPVPQASFLGQLGAVERASRLMAANPAQAGAIEAGVQRLLAPVGMGSRFLALGVRSPNLAPLPALS